MNRSIRTLMLIAIACFLVGCSDKPRNITGNASQAEIDNYNDLIKQAEDEMKGDGEVEDLKDE